MATLTHDTTVIQLSDDLLWSDEFEWNPIEQSATRTVTGALIVEVSTMIGGRPITLAPPDDDAAWTKYEDVIKLNQLAAVPGLEMTLVFRGLTFNVMFRHQDKQPVLATAVLHYQEHEPNDPFLVTLKLMEI